ncbi:M16 family metallopeptidase [Fulvivirga ligni]|uniref:M16 family metallopeptidase n=1 Tax=Fulvivirga ligni TaxID=2904246 RepID=UPI001F2AEA43|nr:pitrilysin family protein [Fulvivirga ligni]UII21930.1 insulinase family protein [Fulvivirga ligni]
MIEFNSFTLDNGLRVIVHEDKSVQTAVLNIIYDVGSRDEDPEKTGFAHLFEHLMFGGSKHIESYDEPLQQAGGENNAFTTPDVTNYYMTLPYQNLETGFWLESDRMLSLSFDPQVLETQQKVVIEEFKQRYLNQPYGDLWLKLRPLAYNTHSYQWPTIGKEISHIEEATMEDVKSFFYKHYIPNQAILVVAGNVDTEQVKELANKWFGPIPAGAPYKRALPKEPRQNERRFFEIQEDVPTDVLTMAFHMPGKYDPDYNAVDLISDILGREKSSRLYQKLVKDETYFSSINSYITGSIDPGLLVISGQVADSVSIEEAEKKVWGVIQDFLDHGIEAEELEKVKNQAESTLVFSEVEILSRARSLAFAALSGNANYVNEEGELIQSVTQEKIASLAPEILRETNCSVLYYKAKEKKI